MRHGKSGADMTSGLVDPAFWNGKRVLVTGHTGFKGSWLSLWLQSMNAIVRGLGLPPPTEPALFEVAKVRSGMQHCLCDIRDLPAVHNHVNEFRPQVIFHMAAQPLVRRSYQEPVETYVTNVMGTVHLLEAARKCSDIRSIVNVTTDKCYENREGVWGYREDEPMGGHDPYSSSKGCAELVSAAYRQSFLSETHIAMATARAGNVIGGGDWAQDRLVPDILRALEKQLAVRIRNPHAIRPWQHVLEPLSGYLTLAQGLFHSGQDLAEGWNFGPLDDNARAVNWIAEQVCRFWGAEASWLPQEGDQPHEAAYLKLDISKAKQRLFWQPVWPLDRALAKTVEWHRAWLKGTDMRELCLEQILDYGAGR